MIRRYVFDHALQDFRRDVWQEVLNAEYCGFYARFRWLESVLCAASELGVVRTEQESRWSNMIRTGGATASGDTVSGDIKGRIRDGVIVWELRRIVSLALPSKRGLNLCKVIKQSSWDAYLRLFELEIIPSRKSANARGAETAGLQAEHYVTTAAMLLLLLHGSVHRHTKKDKEHFTAVMIGALTCTGASQVDRGKENNRVCEEEWCSKEVVTMDNVEQQLRMEENVHCDVDIQGTRCNACDRDQPKSIEGREKHSSEVQCCCSV
eukprot:1790666-Amphidinium_carterae.3